MTFCRQSEKIKLALTLLSLAALQLSGAQPTEARRDSLPEPPAVEAPVDLLVTPPGEEVYFPVRPDGQPFLVNIDTTVNLTDKINGFYYDPKFRGEVWAPFDQVSLIERATRMMATWPEYDQFSIYRKFNGVHKFFEKYSGFGP
jgi:hypothetical protein